MIMIIIITVNKMGKGFGGANPTSLADSYFQDVKRRGRSYFLCCDKAVKNFPAYVSVFRIDLNSFARLLRLSFGSTIKGR